MSVDATRWAWMQQGISGAQKLVLLSLADRAGEDGECYPSISRLVADTCMDRKTVMAAISHLIADGLVVDTGSRIGNGVRVLRIPGIENRETSTKSGTGTKSGTSTKSGTATSTKSGTGTGTKSGTQNLSMNLSMNLKDKTTRARGRDVSCPPDVPEQVWIDFQAQRKALKAPITETAINGIRREASAAGITLADALAMCCERGWRGFRAAWLADKPDIKKLTDPAGRVSDVTVRNMARLKEYLE